MNPQHIAFIDDEPLVVDMMVKTLQQSCASELSYDIFADPDMLAERLEAGALPKPTLIVVDRFLFTRDTLGMRLPALFRSAGFTGKIVLFSYIPADFAEHGYDGYVKKDFNAVHAITQWL